MFLKRTALLGILAGGLLASQASAARIDVDSIPTGVVTSWTASNTYVLHGKVIIKNGSRLNIAAGTKILAAGGTGPDCVMLIVSRGGRIYATGSAAQPIIFTSIIDTMTNPLPISDVSRGLWGGINIFGRAPGNDVGGVADMSSDITISDTSLIRYGDSANATSTDSAAKNANDTSGVLQYVSVRYTGAVDMSEIKGLIFFDVGRGTMVDHCEVFDCNEDGINFTGGTVNAKYLISAFQAGDALMLQGGYQGKLQYVFAIQTIVASSSKNGTLSKWESDDHGNKPWTMAQVYNFTGIGTGTADSSNWKYKYGIYIKDACAGTLENSIVSQCFQYGLYVEDLCADNDTCAYHNSRARLEDSTLVIKNNIFHGFGHGDNIDSICEGSPFLQTYEMSHTMDTADPMFGGLSWTRSAALDPRPSASGPATQHVATVPSDGFFDQTTYRGAFAPTGPLWAAGWSVLSSTGIFTSSSVSVVSSVSAGTKADAGMKITGKGENRILSWNQQHASASSVLIFTTNGRLVRTINNGYTLAGAHSQAISLKDIPAGVYLLQAKSVGQVESSLVEKQ